MSVITDGIDDASPTCGGGTPRIDRGNKMYVSIAIKPISMLLEGWKKNRICGPVTHGSSDVMWRNGFVLHAREI